MCMVASSSLIGGALEVLHGHGWRFFLPFLCRAVPFVRLASSLSPTRDLCDIWAQEKGSKAKGKPTRVLQTSSTGIFCVPSYSYYRDSIVRRTHLLKMVGTVGAR